MVDEPAHSKYVCFPFLLYEALSFNATQITFHFLCLTQIKISPKIQVRFVLPLNLKLSPSCTCRTLKEKQTGTKSAKIALELRSSKSPEIQGRIQRGKSLVHCDGSSSDPVPYFPGEFSEPVPNRSAVDRESSVDSSILSEFHCLFLSFRFASQTVKIASVR